MASDCNHTCTTEENESVREDFMRIVVGEEIGGFGHEIAHKGGQTTMFGPKNKDQCNKGR